MEEKVWSKDGPEWLLTTKLSPAKVGMHETIRNGAARTEGARKTTRFAAKRDNILSRFGSLVNNSEDFAWWSLLCAETEKNCESKEVYSEPYNCNKVHTVYDMLLEYNYHVAAVLSVVYFIIEVFD